ncbi:hypothetical protein EX895_002384 [Sporisorium graminicola]|uniref:Uncharacterized protein n=1 Tax=Sporisorium graminicola TaxID=280036 RepID=A0A4U7KVX3_9BASI|nr:hypothetical protein EX895_002384 [Sporisorium graminicola]TKY88753.1 hypothetical protein EX895_002384 [Sporisorium graminicola]
MANSTNISDWLGKLCNGTTDFPTKARYDLTASGIILPPSVSHDAFSNDVAIVAATLYCWEYLMTVPSELGIYVTIPLRAPHLILFVLMRYTTLVAISLGLYATWRRQSGDCIPYREICTLLVQLSVSAVLGWRTIAIWQRDARIIVIVFLLLTTLMLFSSLLVLSLKSRKLSNGACLLVENGNYEFFPLAWFYAGTVLYDTIVIVLSTYRLWQHHKDVVAFPEAGATKKKGRKPRIHWLQWLHSQWNSLTPLLFRLASNGVLYFGFSMVFNIVCFVVGHWDERRAQDLMLLYSSVMWIVCQRLVLLEVKATWRDRLSIDGLKQAGDEETDRLIARILQASWSSKPPPPMNGKPWTTEGMKDKSKEQLVLSLSVDSCLRAAPISCCACSRGREAQSKRSRAAETSRPSGLGVEHNDAEMGEARVHQLHDFRLSLPEGFFDEFGAASRTPMGSKTVDSVGVAARTNMCNDESDPEARMETGIKRRLGTLLPTRAPHKLFAASPNRSPRSDTTVDTAASNTAISIDHPLLDSPSIPPRLTPHSNDATPSSRLSRLSHAFDGCSKSTSSLSIPTTSNCTCSYLNKTDPAPDTEQQQQQQHRRTSQRRGRAITTLPSLEVADMLANMTDDAKTTALALAGMEGVQPSLAGSELFASPRAQPPRPLWIIHPPL